MSSCFFRYLYLSFLTIESTLSLCCQAVKNKHLDMKSAADKLGVSYGTLYGRYRELFGYLKQGWTASHNPSRSKPSTNPNIDVPMVDEKLILDQVAKGNLSMTEAAEALSLEPSSVAYHLSSRVGISSQHTVDVHVQTTLPFRIP